MLELRSSMTITVLISYPGTTSVDSASILGSRRPSSGRSQQRWKSEVPSAMQASKRTSPGVNKSNSKDRPVALLALGTF